MGTIPNLIIPENYDLKPEEFFNNINYTYRTVFKHNGYIFTIPDESSEYNVFGIEWDSDTKIFSIYVALCSVSGKAYYEDIKDKCILYEYKNNTPTIYKSGMSFNTSNDSGQEDFRWLTKLNNKYHSQFEYDKTNLTKLVDAIEELNLG